MERPDWLKATTLLWTVDDAHPPDAEMMGAAWKRFFNEEMPLGTSAIATHDEGDCCYFRHAKGILRLGHTKAILVEPTSPWADWTINPQTGKSNSSVEYAQLVEAVCKLLGSGSAGDVLRLDWMHNKATLIVAQLAHVHSMRPVKPPDRIFVKGDNQ